MKVILLAVAAVWALLFIPWARHQTMMPLSADQTPLLSTPITWMISLIIGLLALFWAALALRRPANSFLPIPTLHALAFSSALAWLAVTLLALSACFLLRPSAPFAVLAGGAIIAAALAWWLPRRLSQLPDAPVWSFLAQAGMILFIFITFASGLHLFLEKRDIGAHWPPSVIQRLQAQNLVSLGVIILTAFVLGRLWFRFRRLSPLSRALLGAALIMVMTNLAVLTTWRYQKLLATAHAASPAPERTIDMTVRPTGSAQ
jgi:uncharacterized membrane protein YidH (DUF202 family)